MDVIKELVEYLRENPSSNVDEFFQSIIWSTEKDEWNKMTDEEKLELETKIRRLI